MSLSIQFGADYSGVRVDIALTEVLADEVEAFAGASRTQIQKLISSGGVLINGKPPKKNLTLAAGDRAEVSPEIWAELTRDRAEIRYALDSIPFTLETLYEDAHLLAIAKPAGVTVHPVQGMAEPTAVDYLRASGTLLADTGETLKPGIVHRLDKGTSGIMLVAKDGETHWRLQAMFEHRLIHKHYLSVTLGPKLPERGNWEYRLARNPKHRELFMAAEEGRYSLTFYRALARNGLCNLLLMRIITGRTHQIRVHLKENGHGIIGDCDYSNGINQELLRFLEGGDDTTLNKAWPEALYGPAERALMRGFVKSTPGIFLHAYAIGFTHPISREWMSLAAQPPPYFTGLCGLFGWEIPSNPAELLEVGGGVG